MENEKKKTISTSMKSRISKAMKGNRNAEKWTVKLVTSILEKMIDILEQPYEIELDSTEEEKEVSGKAVVDENGQVSNDSKGYTKKKVRKVERRVHLKHELLMIFKIRNTKWFAQMREKFDREFNDLREQENEFLQEEFEQSIGPVSYLLSLLDYIDSTCMVNTYNDAANGATNSTMAKMSLSTHYNWSDRVESKVEHDGKVEVETPDVPDWVKEAFEKSKNAFNQEDND